MKQASSRVMSAFEDSFDRTLDFERMVELYRPRIFRFALASLADRDAAETVSRTASSEHMAPTLPFAAIAACRHG